MIKPIICMLAFAWAVSLQAQDPIYFDVESDTKIDWNANTGFSAIITLPKKNTPSELQDYQLPANPLPSHKKGEGKVMMRLMTWEALPGYVYPSGSKAQSANGWQNVVLVWNTKTMDYKFYALSSRSSGIMPEVTQWRLPLSKADLGEGEYMFQPVPSFWEYHNSVGETSFFAQILVWNTKNGKAKLFRAPYTQGTKEVEWEEVPGSAELFPSAGEGEIGQYQYMVSGQENKDMEADAYDYTAYFHRYDTRNLQTGKLIVYRVSEGISAKDRTLPSNVLSDMGGATGKAGKYMAVRATARYFQDDIRNFVWIIDTQTGRSKHYSFYDGEWSLLKSQFPEDGLKSGEIGKYVGFINPNPGLPGEGTSPSTDNNAHEAILYEVIDSQYDYDRTVHLYWQENRATSLRSVDSMNPNLFRQ